jgi:hypothetical protein
MPLLPALADVGTGGFFADGMKAMIAHDRARLLKSGRAGRTDAKPARLLQYRCIWSRRLFGMANARHATGCVDEGYQKDLSNSAKGKVRGQFNSDYGRSAPDVAGDRFSGKSKSNLHKNKKRAAH